MNVEVVTMVEIEWTENEKWTFLKQYVVMKRITVSMLADCGDSGYALVAQHPHGDQLQIFYRPAAIVMSDHGMYECCGHRMPVPDLKSDATSRSTVEMLPVIDGTNG